MEKPVNSDKIHESLTLINRQKINIEGIVEIIASNESNILLKLKDTHLSIYGKNISISKLDIECGILEAEGIFDNIKYGKNGGFLKKIFK